LALVVTVAALPVVLWFNVGKSEATAIVKAPVEVVFLTIPVLNAPKNWAPVSPASVVPWTINLFAKPTLADPSTELPANVLAVVHLAAEPSILVIPVNACAADARFKAIAVVPILVVEEFGALSPELPILAQLLLP
jgi:hypothetical protein